MKYVVLFEHSDANWSAYVPDLPGCIATGKTKAETEKLIREAIEFHIDGMRLDGEPVPSPTTEVEYISVPA
jgi:predicted RNase H-like HicB family nuclease